MNIVFHNPQSIWFKTNISCYYAGTKSINKYDFLFDYIYKNESKIKVLLDRSNKSTLFRGSLKFINNPVLDFFAWALLNRLNPFKFEIIRDAKSLSSHDVIFSFIYGTFTYLNFNQGTEITNLVNNFKYSKAFKIVHLTHYGYNTKCGSLNTKDANIQLFVSENNLNKNSTFFRNYFKWYNKDVEVIPFVAQDRFKNKINFTKRFNKALCTGTYTHKIVEDDFTSFFKTDVLQPMRKEIFENSNKLAPYLDFFLFANEDMVYIY